jgi:dTDP-4-dehydrorhamnose reductase
VRIVVIGSNGQLGTDLMRVLGHDGVGLDFPEIDVRDADSVRRALQETEAAALINCAAMTNVDGCETAATEAFAVNAVGAMNVAVAAAAMGAAVLYVSTDYVFGGDAERLEPYVETDEPSPINVYGASKLAGEQLTRAYNDRHYVVRTCGLFGHAGALGKGGNFVETIRRRAAEGQPLRVVNDQRISPTSTRELSWRLVELVRTGAFGLYHAASSDTCTWYEFARAIVECVGSASTVSPVSSSEYPTAARRPALSALGGMRLSEAGVPACGSWQRMLEAYLGYSPIPSGV